MHGPSLATFLVVATLGLASSAITAAGTSDSVAEARRKLAQDDGIAAVAILEAALPGATTGKEAVLVLLQQAYEIAEKQSRNAGRLRDAETYRENLKILNRKSRPARTPPSNSDPAPVEATPTPVVPVETPPPLPDPSANPEPTPPVVADAPPVSTARPLTEPSNETSAKEPQSLLPMPNPTPADDLSTADAAFSNKDYREAGRIYTALARARQLPPERRDHWLYCRAFEVVNQINARPRTDAEWSSIKAEVDQIRALNPSNYLGEYLRDLVAERQSGGKKTKPSGTLVVRGSAPEEPATPSRPVKPVSNPAVAEPVKASAVSASNNSAAAARIGTNVGRWQILDSANFRIYHADPSLAARVARAAEAARLAQLKRWSNPVSKGSWTPACEIYLYPGAKQYAQMTGQPEDSPGFSTMGMNGGRIISRRVNLRADHPTLVEAVLPHEITHVILADHFTEQQIPRWADEGLAVLAEPIDEQQRRAADLNGPLAANRLFPVDALMSMDYPDNRYWALYYAQSVSLSRFLVEQGTPAQMLQFLQGSQREGYENALRRVYKINGFPDLQRRWLEYARARVEVPATASAPATGPDLKIR